MTTSSPTAARPVLGDLAVGRDNNLNLIRAVAATGVLISHAWPIAQGQGTPEPMEALTGFSLGALCVFVFFAVSGFLIAGSWTFRPQVGRFLAARALRLWPGLIVSLVVVSLGIGPLVAEMSLTAYLHQDGVWSFLWRNTGLVAPQYTLPGVFETNPYPTVEGSIWTLVHEVACYLALLICGIVGLLRADRLPWLVVAGLLAWVALPLTVSLPGRVEAFHGLALPFGIGMAFFAWRDRLVLSGRGAVVAILAALVVAQVDPMGPGGMLSRLALSGALAYGTFWLAYVPGGAMRGFNRLGDYSYGIYIYAFPIQGMVAWWLGPHAPLANVALALPLTLLPAVLSWHLVERPALGLLRRRVPCTA